MENKFFIYSTEISPTLTPTSANILIPFDNDPIHGNYNPNGEEPARGSVIKTLGGTVIQDFGVEVTDGRISFSDVDALSQATVTALKAAYIIVDEQWYFTDGYECWKVQFSRNPKGFNSFRNLLFAFHAHQYFSYEINLIVITKEI